MLGPAGRGQIATIIIWPSIISIVGYLGFGEALVFYAARSRLEPRVLTGTALTVSAIQATVLTLITALVMPRTLSRYGAEALMAGWIYLAWLPISMIGSTAMNILLGMLEVRTFNRLRLLVIAATVAGLALAYALRLHRLSEIALVYVLANVLTSLAALALVARRGWLAFKPDLSFVPEMLSYGLKSHVGSVSGLANERADQAIISLVLAPMYLGLYSVSVSLTAPMSVVGTPLATVTLPAVAAAASEAHRQARFYRFVRVSLIVSLVIAILGFLLIPAAIRVLFGPAFEPAANVSRVLLLATVILNLNRMIGASLKGFNRPLDAGIGEIVGTVVTIVGLAVLIPMFGIMGAAVASGAAYVATLAFLISRTVRLGLNPLLLLPEPSDIGWAASQLASFVPRPRGTVGTSTR